MAYHMHEVASENHGGMGPGLLGSVSGNPFPEVLKSIVDRELSGDLQVTSGKTTRTVYFDRGFLVFAGSNLKKDRLTQRLLASGRLTEQEIDLAFKHKRGRRRIGEAMVAVGLLTEEEVGKEVARQIRQITLAPYGLKNGFYSFDERSCAIPMDVRLGLSIYRIQLEGVRRMKNMSLILKGLPSFEQTLRLSERPPFSFAETDLEPLEKKILDVAEGGINLNEILVEVDEKRQDVLRAVYGLLTSGILEIESGERRPVKVQEEIDSFLLSGLDRDPRATLAENVRQEVLLQYDALDRATPLELLDLEEAADEKQIEEAFEARQKEWKKKQDLLDKERTLYIKVNEIRERLAKARAAILAEKSEKVVQIEDAPDESTDPFSTKEPFGEPSFASAPKMDSVALKERIQQLLYDLKLRKAVNDSEGVISFLYEIVKLVPDSAKYEGMLAQALGSHPVLNKKAERHFRRALSIDPHNAKLHYALARYYQSFDMKSRALSELKIALKIDPSFADARKALVELKGGDSGPVGKVFKKFFG
jgi:tetratricopeptide (TPR) repeat protein